MPLRIAHWVIIVNFAFQILYGGYMVFFKITPPGVIGPLGGAAELLPPDKMMTRRLYALETWVAISGLAIYVAITEVLPRQLIAMKRNGA